MIGIAPGTQRMGNHLVSEILSTVSHNLCIGSTLLECIETESHELQPEARKKLALVHVGLAMALDALQSQELEPWLEGEDSYQNPLSF